MGFVEIFAQLGNNFGLFSFPEIHKILHSRETHLLKVVARRIFGGSRKTREKKVRLETFLLLLFFLKENETSYSHPFQSGVISSKDVNFSRQFN